MGTYQVLPVVVPFHPQKDEIKTPCQVSDLVTTQFDLDLGHPKFQCPQNPDLPHELWHSG